MHRLDAQRLEDEHVERALNDVGIWIAHKHSGERSMSDSSPSSS
jgi:hypothetical protein